VYSGGLPEDPETLRRVWDDVHRRSAERLLDLCKSNGGVFVKVGQHLGALDYLLPPPYIETLRVLHSQAPPSSIEDVYSVIKKDLKVKDVHEVFSEFETKELGAASLAQVYKATLKESGEVVAVKVQHAKVKAHSFVDMKTMEVLVRTAARIFPDFKLLWLVDETKKNLPQELDFLHEASNADILRALMGDVQWLKIPRVHWNVSTERVLVMEYCAGGQINDEKYLREHKIPTHEVAEKLGRLYSEMIFSHGFVHCDPHPGNLLVSKNPVDGSVQISLLDHGLYTTLSPEFRYNYAQFWLSIINSNVDGIKKYGRELGVGNLYGLFACMVTARSWESITSTDGGVAKKVTAEEEQRIRKNIGNYLPQISQILEDVPRPMILIFKTNDLIRGIEHALKTTKTMKSFTTISKYCANVVYEEDYRNCSEGIKCYKFKVYQKFVVFKITLYEIYLWLRSILSLAFRCDVC